MALEPITRQEKIIAGQDLTPITRLEKFLKQFGGGGGGLPTGSAPYQQLVTDGEGNAKWTDRLAYETDPVLTEIIPQTTVAFTESGKFMAAFWPENFDLVYGRTYLISWDGVDYICTGILSDGVYPVLGNLGLAGSGEDTGEPFLFMKQGQWEVGSTESATEHVIGISEFDGEVVKIDEKYLPPSAVRAFNFPENVPHDQMVDAITAFESGSASIVWNGDKVIRAFYNSSDDTISVTFAKEPLAILTYSNRSGVYHHELGSATYGEVQAKKLRISNDGRAYSVLTVEGKPSDVTLKVGAERIFIQGCELSRNELILLSSTYGSSKRFKITVDDSGTISATEVTP